MKLNSDFIQLFLGFLAVVLSVEGLVIALPAPLTVETTGNLLVVTFDTQGAILRNPKVMMGNQLLCSISGDVNEVASCSGYVPCGLEANSDLVASGIQLGIGFEDVSDPVSIILHFRSTSLPRSDHYIECCYRSRSFHFGSFRICNYLWIRC